MTARAVFFSQRRGACPGLSAPMPTGDGLLVRFMPTGTVLPAAFAALCAAAQRYGNGIVEVTSRGSIQIRGLSVASAPRLADAITALDIAAADGVLVLTNALAGLAREEILDAGTLTTALRGALARGPFHARLAAKVSVAIDGGGALGLDEISADIRLRAARTNGNVALRVAVGGTAAEAANLGSIAPGDGIEAAIRLLGVLARHGREARAREILAAGGISAFHAAVSDLLIADAPQPDTHPSREAVGLHPLRDGSLACGLGLAFGHADAAALERLVERAAMAGASGVRTAPGRALMIVGVAGEAASALMAEAERLGFIARADDPRRHVIACAGAPVCAAGHIAARAIAPVIAEIAGPWLADKSKIHISGCAKGCAHAGTAALTVVGGAAGCGLVADGTVRDAAFATVATEALPAAVARHVRETTHGADHV